MANLSNVIKISKTDYETLVGGGTITKNGVTYSYDPNAIYLIAPEAVGSASQPIYINNNGDFVAGNTIPSAVTSINGLSGGSLTTPLVVTGGDSASVGKIALDRANAGQITDASTSTLFGFTTNNATTLTIGHNSYAVNLRGSGTRPQYKGSDLALYSDLPSAVSASASEVSGATEAKSITIGSTSWNLPSGGGDTSNCLQYGSQTTDSKSNPVFNYTDGTVTRGTLTIGTSDNKPFFQSQNYNSSGTLLLSSKLNSDSITFYGSGSTSAYTEYKNSSIVRATGFGTFTFTLPSKTGTLALTSDVPGFYAPSWRYATLPTPSFGSILFIMVPNNALSGTFGASSSVLTTFYGVAYASISTLGQLTVFYQSSNGGSWTSTTITLTSNRLYGSCGLLKLGETS